VLHQVEGEATQVVPVVEQTLHHREETGEVPCPSRSTVSKTRSGGLSEDLGDRLGRDLGAGEGEHLLEDRLGVAQRAVAGAHDGLDRAVVDRVALELADARTLPATSPADTRRRSRRWTRDRIVGSTFCGSVVAIANITCAGRFLDELEQRVERRGRGHVDLVEDVDLAAGARRGEQRPVPQLAGVVDAAVGRHVELDHVDRGPRR
jgi:hypothetical protein